MTTFSNIEDSLITKFLKNELTKEERVLIIKWLEESDDNKEFLFSLKEAYFTSQWKKLSKKADTNNEWEKISLRLQQKNTRTSKKISRKETVFKWASMVAAIVVLFISGYYTAILNLHKEPTNLTISTKEGELASIVLADGTIVKLNFMSKLSYPSNFSKQNRQVFLEGEAFFDVQHDELNPFRVKVNGYTVQVLGTQFNVSAYDTDSLFSTTLKNGKIQICELTNQTDYQLLLQPGTRFVYLPATGNSYLEKADMDAVFSWVTGKIMFKNSPLHEVSLQLQRKFGYTFNINSQELKHVTYTATIQDETLEEILQNISIVTPQVKYTINEENKEIIFTRRE